MNKYLLICAMAFSTSAFSADPQIQAHKQNISNYKAQIAEIKSTRPESKLNHSGFSAQKAEIAAKKQSIGTEKSHIQAIKSAKQNKPHKTN